MSLEPILHEESLFYSKKIFIPTTLQIFMCLINFLDNFFKIQVKVFACFLYFFHGRFEERPHELFDGLQLYLVVVHKFVDCVVDFRILSVRSLIQQARVVNDSKSHILLRVFKDCLQELSHIVLKLICFLFPCKTIYIVGIRKLFIKLILVTTL